MLPTLFKTLKQAGAKANSPPSVPIMSQGTLKALRETFHLNHYANQAVSNGESRQNILHALFADNLSVGVNEARQIFHVRDLDGLIKSGLLCEDGNGIKAGFQAQVYGGLIFFSDFFQWESNKDFVLPIGPAGNYLVLLTIRRHVESTLDIGCGCGVQALLAARHSDKVIATDINPRALSLTRLNAELNDIHNIETYLGSYFEPVQNQRFDLMVAHLPYVIAPEKHLIYRTADQLGDRATYERLRETPAYLKEGGFAQILINWIHSKNQDPSQPIRKTLENKNVDTWLIHNGSKSPDQYTEMWLKNQRDPRKFRKAKQDWLRWYQNNRIEQIALGAITLRRRSNSRNWFCSTKVNRTLVDPASEQFLRLFAVQDYLNEIENKKTLLNEKLVPVDLDFAGDEDQPIAYANHGSQFEWRVHPVTKAVVHNLDGTITLGKGMEAARHSPGLSAKESQNDILEDIQKLLELGMVVPVDINQ